MKTLAIFDFCETLVDFQSLGRFLDIAGTQNPRFRRTKIQRKILPFLYRNTRLKIFKYHISRYEQLRGLSVDFVEDLARKYFENELIKRVNERVINRLKMHQQRGDHIVIVSGGLEVYIKYFAAHFGVARENIIAVELDCKNGVLSGQIDGIHSMCERKLYKLERRVDLSAFDRKKSWVYSDCASDIPLLSFVGNPVAIRTHKEMHWAEMLGYEIL